MQDALQKIVQKIVETVDPERIYLMTSASSTRKVESVFAAPLQWNETEHYDLLVVLKGGADTEENIRMQDKIEQRCQHIIPTTVLVLPFGMFNTYMAQGHAFIRKAAIPEKLLFDAKTKELAPLGLSNMEAWEERNVKKYSQWYENGMCFLVAYELFMVRKQYRMAAFNLHQAAEQFFKSIFQAITGFSLTTHNLQTLHRYTRGFARELATLFPDRTNRLREGFRLLVKSYSDSRYDEEFKIQYEELTALHGEVQKLYLITRNIVIGRDKKARND